MEKSITCINLNDQDETISLFINELSKMTLLLEDQLELLHAIFKKDNQNQHQAFRDLAHAIVWYYYDNKAVPRDAKILLSEANRVLNHAVEQEEQDKRETLSEKPYKEKKKLRRSQRLIDKNTVWW